LQSLIINAAAELGIGKVGSSWLRHCLRRSHIAPVQLVACALAHVLPSAHGGSGAGVGGQGAVAGLKLRGDDVDLNHL
jgi:hypothetical protein